MRRKQIIGSGKEKKRSELRSALVWLFQLWTVPEQPCSLQPYEVNRTQVLIKAVLYPNLCYRFFFAGEGLCYARVFQSKLKSKRFLD